jgi:hypothetical protein
MRGIMGSEVESVVIKRMYVLSVLMGACVFVG